MDSPGNWHCASCIGTLSFPIQKQKIAQISVSWFKRYFCKQTD